jgi:hypothetical protein
MTRADITSLVSLPEELLSLKKLDASALLWLGFWWLQEVIIFQSLTSSPFEFYIYYISSHFSFSSSAFRKIAQADGDVQGEGEL